MIIYNVTIAVQAEIEEEFIHWLKTEHIPEVLETQLFTKAKVFKVIENLQTKAHSSYAVQYSLQSWADLEHYQKEHAASLQQKTKARYGEGVLAFRTFLEELD